MRDQQGSGNMTIGERLDDFFTEWKEDASKVEMNKKIMLFTQTIDDLNSAIHDVFWIPKKDFGYCFYHHDGKGGFTNDIQFVVKAPFIMEETQMCMECAMRLYGGYKAHSTHGRRAIPIDPMLDYLNEIDPIPMGDE